MVHSRTRCSLKNGKGGGEQNKWPYVIQEYDGDTGSIPRKTLKKDKEDIDRKKRKRGDTISPLDGQKGANADKA